MHFTMRFIFKPSDLRYLTMTSSKIHLSNPKPTSPNTSLPIPSLYFFLKSPHFYSTNNGNKYSPELWEAFQGFCRCFKDFDPKWWPEVEEQLSKGYDLNRWLDLAARIETHRLREEEQDQWERELEQEQFEEEVEELERFEEVEKQLEQSGSKKK